MKKPFFFYLIALFSILTLNACVTKNNTTNYSSNPSSQTALSEMNYQEMIEEQQVRAADYNDAHPHFGGRR